MAALQNSGKKRSEIDQLVERYKIEDFIFETHRCETEHFLLLKKEQIEREQQNESNVGSDQHSTKHSTSQSAASTSFNEDDEEVKADRGQIEQALKLVADQPRELDDWTPERQC